MSKSIVSMVSFKDSYTSLKKLIEECDGFAGLNPEDKILIKPNIVSWEHIFDRYRPEDGFELNHWQVKEGNE